MDTRKLKNVERLRYLKQEEALDATKLVKSKYWCNKMKLEFSSNYEELVYKKAIYN